MSGLYNMRFYISTLQAEEESSIYTKFINVTIMQLCCSNAQYFRDIYRIIIPDFNVVADINITGKRQV